MITSNFLLLFVGIFILGMLSGIIAGLISNNRKKSISESFSNNRTYWKYTDQSDSSIDEVVKDFKLLND